MITGFNTDIKHGERVFHVQTEDRGLGNPVVESLVYVGGEILLSKKTAYTDHVQEGRVNEKAVKEIMDLQHRRIIEAIRRGRFDRPKPGAEGGPPGVGAPGAPAVAPALPPVSAAAAAAAAAILASKTGAFGSVPPGPPRAPQAPGSIQKSSPAPSAARSPSGVGTPGERSLDQVIIDYLASEAASEHLELSLMCGGELIAGDSVAVSVRAQTSLTEKAVAGAHVSIRVVSTTGPPQILYRGLTGNDGFIKATLQIPELGPANAALIISASSSLGNNEIKQLIRKRS